MVHNLEFGKTDKIVLLSSFLLFPFLLVFIHKQHKHKQPHFTGTVATNLHAESNILVKLYLQESLRLERLGGELLYLALKSFATYFKLNLGKVVNSVTHSETLGNAIALQQKVQVTETFFLKFACFPLYALVLTRYSGILPWSKNR